MCPICEGDVRLPPPTASTDTKAIPTLRHLGASAKLKACHGKINADVALDLITVMCALKCCPAPRYHLKCSGVPKGSRIFRNTVVTHQVDKGAVTANESAAKNKCGTKHILEHLYSSPEDVWWDLPTDTKIMIDGKQFSHRSQQALQNDVNWPTSMLSFMCPECDVEGTSRFLCEYFERFHSMKASFYADYLRGQKSAVTGNRRDRAEESAETRTGVAFLRHLMIDNRKRYLKKSQSKEKPGHCGSWNPSEIQLESMASTRTFLSKQLQQQKMPQHQRYQAPTLSPSYLVGRPIRLFSPIDNSYHSGRVLDCKVNAPYKVDRPIQSGKSCPSFAAAPMGQLTDEKICSTLFLIRFRPGVEGRKIAVHQWLYLEEHAITVGGEVCLAKVAHHSQGAKVDAANKAASKPGKVKSMEIHKPVLKSETGLQPPMVGISSQYRPVQIIFRSMLEMIPVQNMNSIKPPVDIIKLLASRGKPTKKSPCLNVLATGFGRAFAHVRISFEDGRRWAATTGEPSEVDETQKSIFDDTSEPTAIPLTSDNPPWINQIIHRAQLSNEDVALGLAMACMENEEERRIRTWMGF